MSTSPRLDDDILLLVVSFASPSSCATLMRTSKFFYREVPTFILRQSICLPSSYDVEKLVRFIAPEGFSRCRHVRELVLKLEHISYDVGRELARCVRRMEQLHVLCIVHGEPLLADCPDLCDAVAGLTSLRQLDISHVGLLSCGLLKAAPPGLVSIFLDWPHGLFGGSVNGGVDWNQYHPIPLLSKWASTLEELGCNYWYTSRDPPSFTEVYPKLRNLAVGGLERQPFIAPLVKAYPNVTHLGAIHPLEGSSVFSSSMTAQRSHSGAHEQGLSNNGTAAIWKHLQEYTGGLTYLNSLGLTYRIPRLYLFTYVREFHFHMLAEVISRTQPERLRVAGGDSLLIHPTRNIAALLLEAGASHLQTLILDISLEDDALKMDIPMALEDLASSLDQLPLRHLKLSVHVAELNIYVERQRAIQHHLWRLWQGLPSPPPDIPVVVQPSLASLDVNVFARRLVDANPALNDVVVKVTQVSGYQGEARISKGGQSSEVVSAGDQWDFS
ncbi:hypothetical protein C8Q76DRAFT_800311 [Earliella scabrosa]|nr:hypothetical protein C8Q76DRAFT_800311 [Earliella scabrosa]